MTCCYHDEQDIESDMNIEVAREGDIIEEGHDLEQFHCKKNPGHSGFIPFKDLKLEDLPQEVRSIETLESIKRCGNYVVKLVVEKQSNGKLKKNVGSGYVFKSGDKYLIVTNNHVVKSDDEVKHCTVYFFYDSQDNQNVFTSKGVKLVDTCPFRDISFFSFDRVPNFVYQPDVIYSFSSPPSIVMYENNRTVTCRSNPLFKTSELTYYTSENLNNTQVEIMFISQVNNSISYIRSCYFRFQPIPSNIQKVNNVEIHIDEDDGNIRVIPGDVVAFKDDYVIKIPESIFQNEVKKCKLVWNGKVISRGTRLYFQQVKSREVFSDMCEIDLEQLIQRISPNIWLFDIHSQPRGVVKLNEIFNSLSIGDTVCCIGHPHGSIKMVTFGRLLANSLERFDNQYRRIDNPGKDCQCKEVNCLKYSCKTCPGSSGSPVFLPHKMFDMITNYSHFMSDKSVNITLSNGELIENVNIAWG